MVDKIIKIIGDNIQVSDGYHTFNELYGHRIHAPKKLKESRVKKAIHESNQDQKTLAAMLCPCGKHSLKEYKQMQGAVASSSPEGAKTNKEICGLLDRLHPRPPLTEEAINKHNGQGKVKEIPYSVSEWINEGKKNGYLKYVFSRIVPEKKSEESDYKLGDKGANRAHGWNSCLEKIESNIKKLWQTK